MGLGIKDSVNLLFMLASSSLLAWGPMVYEKGGPSSVFSYHPFFMGIAFSLLLTLGFWMFNYEDLPGDWIDLRSSRRKVHAILQGLGLFVVVAGYLAVLIAHNIADGTLFYVSEPPLGFSGGPLWTKMMHIVVGYSTLGLLLVQAMLGVLKFRALADGEESTIPYHAMLGKFVYILGLSNVMTGVWLWEAWSLPIRCVISLTILTSLVFGPRWDGSRGYLSDD